MTAAPRTYSSRLNEHVSYGALEYTLHPFIYAFQLDSNYEDSIEYFGSALGFLARVKLWLKLLWERWNSEGNMPRVAHSYQPNRKNLRRNRRRNGRAAQACPLGYLILRRKGLKACRDWMYNYSRSGRVHWCFKHHRWHYQARRSFANCAGGHLTAVLCNASLRPD